MKCVSYYKEKPLQHNIQQVGDKYLLRWFPTTLFFILVRAFKQVVSHEFFLYVIDVFFCVFFYENLEDIFYLNHTPFLLLNSLQNNNTFQSYNCLYVLLYATDITFAVSTFLGLIFSWIIILLHNYRDELFTFNSRVYTSLVPSQNIEKCRRLNEYYMCITN